MAYQQNPYQQMPQQFTQQIIPQIQQPTAQYSSQLPTVGVFWVPGLAGAQGFNQTANTEAYLRDFNDPQVLFIKTTDQFGRISSLEKYRMVKEEIEETPAVVSTDKFVTVDQLNDILDEKLGKLASKFDKPQQTPGGKRNNGSKRNKPRYDEEDNDDAE